MADEDPVEDMGEGDNFDNADEGREDDATTQPAAPGFLPPPPAFPRSSATPGLESSPFGAQTGTTQQPGTRPNLAPPAYYPFTDQFGRPIPVPTNPNASQQQEDQKQEQQ
jgi:hypothetical protein